MNADAFRQLYDYHFAVNRMLWHFIAQLSPEQFTQPMAYSHGSVRDQIIHLLNVDDPWFSELRGVEPPEPPDLSEDDDRAAIRAYGDGVEQRVRAYLAGLQRRYAVHQAHRRPGRRQEPHRLASAAARGESRHRPSRSAAADIERPRR